MSGFAAPALAPILHYKPSVYYYRAAIRRTDDPHRLRALALEAVAEMERLKDALESLGYYLPGRRVLRDEVEDRSS